MSTPWNRWFGLGALVLTLGVDRPAGAASAESWVYFGTYTGGKSRGIYVSRFDARSGRLGAPELAAEMKNPSFVALHPDGRHLYAVGENADPQGGKGGVVQAFAIDRGTGRLRAINQQESAGAHPCHLVVDRSGNWVLVANYSSGTLGVLPIVEGGALGPVRQSIQHEGSSVNKDRQKEAHAHSIQVDAANRFALSADLGIDKLMVYAFDAKTGTLTPNDPPFASLAPGAGPRHFAFHPNGRRVFVINEINTTITAFDYDPRRGRLVERQTVPTLPGPNPGNASTAEIVVHPSGKFVYGSNRGHNTIVVYALDRRSGAMTLVEHQSTEGRTPRNFAIDPSGRWLLAENQESDSVVVFSIDPKTGALEPTGQKIEVGAPVCAKFLVLR